MAPKKLSITLPADLAEDVERLARERGLAVSAWLTQAAQEAKRHHAALAAMADYEAEFGRFTEAELGVSRKLPGRFIVVCVALRGFWFIS